MKILLIGSGGREHALAWKFAQSNAIHTVFVAPGNAGTHSEKKVINVPVEPVAANFATLIMLARKENVAFTIVGPEAPLAEGIVDAFRNAGLEIFGPSKAAAQLESSKDFCKAFLNRHLIPTAAYQTFTDATAAHAYVNQQGAPIVIKADGLAAGKGVVVAMELEQAHQAIDNMLGGSMGEAGARVVIEEFMVGEEASFIVLADGEHALALASSQDHKRLLDGDEGPNTGGMGAYSPAPVVTPQVNAHVLRDIIHPTLRGMAAEGMPYSGFLYAGLMIDSNGKARVVEFNCRMGDPETQPIMLRLNTDLHLLIRAALDKRLHQIEAGWDRRAALGVVLAAKGYPEKPHKGDIITGLDKNSDNCHVFHAATKIKNGNIITSGGRVLCVTALADSIKMAQSIAYNRIASISFDGMQYRQDIGHRAIKIPTLEPTPTSSAS